MSPSTNLCVGRRRVSSRHVLRDHSHVRQRRPRYFSAVGQGWRGKIDAGDPIGAYPGVHLGWEVCRGLARRGFVWSLGTAHDVGRRQSSPNRPTILVGTLAARVYHTDDDDYHSHCRHEH